MVAFLWLKFGLSTISVLTQDVTYTKKLAEITRWYLWYLVASSCQFGYFGATKSFGFSWIRPRTQFIHLSWWYLCKIFLWRTKLSSWRCWLVPDISVSCLATSCGCIVRMLKWKSIVFGTKGFGATTGTKYYRCQHLYNHTKNYSASQSVKILLSEVSHFGSHAAQGQTRVEESDVIAWRGVVLASSCCRFEWLLFFLWCVAVPSANQRVLLPDSI